jgi:hypothetical protein
MTTPGANTQVVGSRELKRQRDRIRNASMTDEKRSEQNKKRCEAYRRKKTDAANKENNIGISICSVFIYIMC